MDAFHTLQHCLKMHTNTLNSSCKILQFTTARVLNLMKATN